VRKCRTLEQKAKAEKAMQPKYSVTTLDDFFWAVYIVPERLRPLARAFKD
jgi:hypothetical protein